ncbi:MULTISPECIES: pyridoxal 5'-phosphate synthase glutaminase subunit PdxT [Dictyoglomus]|jgi:5'-phosphate synthase pdxT subunit|uniref:pyridoxal 5'-phosphate synthase glutaminase subunit PdxT n=1 Tax=Dictyoglomus TaxID=13 RepID=UPI002356BC30|nr:pyridoxal 5'-phosphate synthase glutaminase subunit PdxT [Dictyoglomus turgidum]
MRIGILAIQGSVVEHEKMLKRLEVETVLVKKPEHLDIINGIILPGGESTTFFTVLENRLLFDVLREKLANGLPAMGTCAGLILLANRIENHPDQKTLKVLDITVSRNAYGRQRESFSTYIKIPILGEKEFECVFIRAPQIVEIGKNVKVHATFENKPIFVEEGNILGLTFHPELTDDLRIHEYFLKRCSE